MRPQVSHNRGNAQNAPNKLKNEKEELQFSEAIAE
jgi:hypothetical protein